MTRRITVMTARWSIVAFAILASVLVVTTAPVAATNTAVVQGGTHTDDTDFENATLDNMTVSGSGDSASVVASTGGSDIDVSNTSSTGASHTFQLGDFDSVTGGPAIQWTGELSTEWDNESGSVMNGGTASTSIGGNVDPTGPNGSPSLTVTGYVHNHTEYDSEYGYESFMGETPDGNPVEAQITYDNPPDSFSALEFIDAMDTSNSNYGGHVKIYVVEGEHVDNTYAEGTKIFDGDIDSSNIEEGVRTYNGNTVDRLDLGGVYEVSDASGPITIGVVSQTDADWTDGDYIEYLYDSSNDDGQEHLKTHDDYSGGYNEYSTEGKPALWLKTSPPSNISVATDAGTSETFGDLGDGESKTADFPLSTTATELTFDGTGGVNYELELKEQTQTTDPGVELNGVNRTHDGVLAEGDTTTLTWDSSDLIKNGENTLDVTLPELSADAPEMLVDYHFYTTTSKEWETAEYVSPTYTLANVTEMQIDTELHNASGTFYVEKYDGASWQQVDTTTFTTNGTHTLNFSDITDTNEVRAKVKFEKTGENNFAEIKSDTAFFKAHGPTSSDYDPPDGTSQNDVTANLSAIINDWDFDTPQTDEVTAQIYLDGSRVETIYGIREEKTISFDTSELAEGQHTWHVEAQDSYGVSHTSNTYTFTVENYAPEIEDSTASPTGDLTQPANTFSINISDRDFAQTSGDTVTAELYIDGDKAGEDTLTANGTAVVSSTVSEGGSHSYYWVATDGYDKETTSETQTVNVPSKFYIRNVSDYSLVNSSTSAKVTFYGESGTVVERTTSNGVIDLDGLPANEVFTASISVEGYHPRTAIVSSLYDQQTAFIADENSTLATTTFIINDKTGDYSPTGTRLQVERALNTSAYPEGDNESTQWVSVSGDYFGATNSISTGLKADERYRLVVSNSDGDKRILGSYVPTGEATTTLTIGEIFWETTDSSSPSANATVEDSNAIVQYFDPAGETESVEVHIANETTTLYRATNSDTQSLRSVINLSENQSDDDLRVWVNATRSPGENFAWKSQLGVVEPVPIDMDQQLLSAISQIGILALAGLLSGFYPKRGSVVLVVFAFGLAWFGWWTIHPAALAIAAVVSFGTAMTTGGRF